MIDILLEYVFEGSHGRIIRYEEFLRRTLPQIDHFDFIRFGLDGPSQPSFVLNKPEFLAFYGRFYLKLCAFLGQN